MSLRESPLVDYLIHRQVDLLRQERRLQKVPLGQPMGCRHPFRVIHPDTGWHLWVPCKSCIPCRVVRRDGWLLRLQMEAGEHERSSFLTLTYADREGRDFYEWDEEEYYRDFQLYMKRLRSHAQERGLPLIRFFRVTELGANRGRYHHHLIAFGRRCEVNNGLGGHHYDHRPWSQGFVEDQPATAQSMGYVAGYVTKTFGSTGGEVRSSQSKGIGLDGLYRLGLALGEAMARVRKPVVVPPRVRIGGKQLPLIDFARKELARGVVDAGAELVPDPVCWIDPLVARAMDRAPERLEREAQREILHGQRDVELRVQQERDRFNPRRL